MPTLKRLRFVRHMTFKEVYARAQIDELKNKIKLNKAMLNEGKVNPESWRSRWLEEVKGYKWAICAWKKLLTQKRKSAGRKCPFCGGEMHKYNLSSTSCCEKCNATIRVFQSGCKIIESQSRYIYLET